MHKPGAKSTHRACVRFDGTRRARRAAGRGSLTQKRNPIMEVCLRDLTDIQEMAFSKEILLKLAQCRLMPFQRFWTMVRLAVGL
ncbi:hypothetical protein KSZ_21010 [Dictyobacter formicarum]|uniref:Uncharacterized protein n=1 Tax=Dictyobacter formicarum TaxID=2778368 RepID=A0ABQ3VD65_9CHLR|nr:hypothetical protein KSZ_21010 [Dictyobacter formicarum]